MASIAAIQITQTSITVDKNGRGTLSFMVTNTFGAGILIGAIFQSEDSGLKDWAEVAKPVERELADQESDTFTVELHVPAGTSPGSYNFSLLLYSVADPNLDFSQSDPIVVVVPELQQAPTPTNGFKMKWWMWLIIGIVIVSIIGVIITISALTPRKNTAKVVKQPPAISMSRPEANTDRPGLDIRGFDLPAADPNLCLKHCEANSGCKAWTYVKPNTIQGPQPRCWIKHGIPDPVSNPCCISGIRIGQ